MENCDLCKKNQETKSVPYAVYELSEAKHARTVKFLVIALVVAILAGFATNLIWIAVFNQYEYVSETYTQDGSGTNIIGDSNAVTNDWGDAIDGSTVSCSQENQEERKG